MHVLTNEKQLQILFNYLHFYSYCVPLLDLILLRCYSTCIGGHRGR